MDIVRQIGRHEVLVDVNESCGVSLEETTLREIASDEDTTTVSKKEILRALSSGDEYYPLSLHWELLDKCNFSCPFCYIVGHSFKRLIRFADIRSHLAELVDEGLLFCILTGGEATVHPDFQEIYRFLKERGVIVEVFTNGFKIDDDVIELFQNYRPYVVEVSLYSMSNEKMREIYGASGDHAAEAVLNNVLRMKRLGLPVVCKTFLNTLTVDELDPMVRWCEDHGIEHYSSSDLTLAYDSADISEFKVNGKEPRKLTILKEGQKNVCFPCGTKNYGCAITPAFEIFPCSSIKHRECFFDLRQLGVRESLHQMKAFMRRFENTEITGSCTMDGKVCKTCIAFARPVRDEAGNLLSFASSRQDLHTTSE